MQPCRTESPFANFDSQPHWYALHTRAKHEQTISAELGKRGIAYFVPTVREVRRWSDRRRIIEVPMFSCYVFVHIVLEQSHMQALTTPGVLRFVGFGVKPAAIPDAEIEAVRSVTTEKVPIWPHAFLRTGQRVRIRGGCLNGIEGILVQQNGDSKLVISLNLIQQSLAVAVSGYDVEPV